MILNGKMCIQKTLVFLSIFFLYVDVQAKQGTHFVIQGDNLFLVDPDTHKESPLAVSKVIITAHDGLLFVNKKQLRLPLVIIKSATGIIRCNNKHMSRAIIISYMRDGTCSCVSYTPIASKQKASACIVKVLLDEKKNTDSVTWQITSKKKITITHHHTKQTITTEQPSLMIELKKGVLYFNKKKCTGFVYMIASGDNHLALNGTVYHGALLITHYKDTFCLINYVPLEEYLYSVLHSESWPGWPLEVNKAFAITSRSYVIAMIMQSKKSDRPYHVKNSNIHQTYRGVHDKKALKDAVQQTNGVFLAYNDAPITAMFDSCCGGVIPSRIQDGIDFKKAPYLARSYACNYCKKCKIFNWQAEMDSDTFMRRLIPKALPKERFKSCKIIKKDPAGLVQEALIYSSRGTYSVTGKQIYTACKEVKSFCFTMTNSSRKLLLKGKGYGHHIGLCQWGAREMVNQGWDYISILQFYYPGTSFMRLS